MTNDNFLCEYTRFASGCTDAPIEFHDFVGMSILSAAVAGNVYFKFGPSRIFPNVYIILLAPSSAYRKTTALRIGKELLFDACPKRILPNQFTPEKLTEILQETPQGILVFSEFISLLDTMQREYMRGLKSMLTDLYDNPPFLIRKTKQSTIRMENPCLTIMAATTTDWFLSGLRNSEADLYGGFLPRFLYIPATSKPTDMAFPPEADQTVRNSLVLSLKSLSEIKGELRFNDDARRAYKRWYKQFGAKANRAAPLLGGFHSRLQMYCLKLACLAELSKTKDLLVGEESMLEACRRVDWLWTQLGILSEEWAFGWFAQKKVKVLQAISRDGGISRSELCRYSRLRKKQLEEILETLMEEERIEVETRRNQDTNRSIRWYLPARGGEHPNRSEAV